MELEAFKNLAYRFIEREDQRKLDQFASDLRGFHSNGGLTHRWALGDDRAVRTVPSKGEYEVDSAGQDVFGTLKSVWEIRKVGNSRHAREFEINGIASTELAIHKLGDACQLAQWKMEIGTAASPGCNVHTHVGLFRVPVPRFPALAVSPLASFEFIIAELFQRRWSERTGGRSNGAAEWRTIQRKRLRAIIRWMDQTVEGALTSPWVAYKNSKPDPKLLMA